MYRHRFRVPRIFAPAVLLSVASVAHAQPSEVSLDEYQEHLAAVHERTDDSGQARRALAVARQVRLPDGTRITLDAEMFGANVPAADAERRAELLDTLLEPLAPTPNRPDPKEAARRILASPEFNEAAADDLKDSWLEKLMRDIGDAIRRFFEWLFGNAPSGPKTNTSGLGAFLALLLRFLLFIAVTLGVVWGGLYVSRMVTARRGKAKCTASEGLDLEDSIADPLGAAKELALRGETRQALRLAYIACLRRLAAAGLLVLHTSRTNWEYQSALQSRSGDAAATLLPATRLFDLVWYGRRDATAQEWEQVLAIHNALPEPLVDTASAGGTKANKPAGANKESGNAW